MTRIIKTYLIMQLLLLCVAKPQERKFYNFNINNISTRIYYNGLADGCEDEVYFEYSKGSEKYVFSRTGILFAGRKDDGEILLNGSTMYSGLKPGRIGDESDEQKIYRVRPDWQTGSMLSEINDNEFNGDEIAIRRQYQNDWYNWPWQDGAPFYDADKDGVYNPDPNGDGVHERGEDIPGYPGAHQTIWFVANAGDEQLSKNLYGSPPMDVEIEVTVWGYNTDSLNNVIFKKTTFVNKSEYDLTEFYAGIWADPDIGSGRDDLAGCDSLLDLGYCYNAFSEDSVYGHDAPAAGVVLLKGLCNQNSDGQIEYLPMRVFWHFDDKLGTPYSVPLFGEYSTGTILTYSLLRGKLALIDFFISQGLTAKDIWRQFPGDPVAGTGYLDVAYGRGGGERKFLMSSGNSKLEKNKFLDMVSAQIVENSEDKENNNIMAVKSLKEKTAYVQRIFKENELPKPNSELHSTETIPSDFQLYQNFPNPFNPSTIIKFDIEKTSTVKIRVFNIACEQVSVLLDEERNAGTHFVIFNGSKLASGVYIYSMEINNQIISKKMILLR